MANIDSREENNNFCAIQFDYFRGMEAEQYSFYRVPKVLFTAECFQTLSCEAKVLYGLMLDRMSLSIKNRWLDEEDRVYIIFTVDEVAELMNCGTQKAVKLMKELDSEKGIGLIEKKRLGLGRPNVIYVKNFLLQDMKKTTEKENSISEQRGDVSQFKNGENHNSEIVKIAIQEVPESSSKNNENHNSGMMKQATQELGKSQSNKTEKNDTDKNETDSIPSYLINQTDKGIQDVIEEMSIYRQLIQDHIEYQCHKQKEVDDLVELMVEVMMMPDNSMIRIAGVDKPVSIVKNRFMKINYSHIEYVMLCMKKNTTKIKNIKTYLITALYNAPTTMNSFYQAEVNHDLFGGT